jgi:hypothetical protein
MAGEAPNSGQRRISRLFNDWAPLVGMTVVSGMFVLVLLKVLIFDETPDIIVAANDSQAATMEAATAIAYAERVSNIAEWTIGAVLTLGAALLGLNWYTSNRNYQEEKERVQTLEQNLQDSVHGTLSEMGSRVSSLETSVNRLQDQQLATSIQVILNDFNSQQPVWTNGLRENSAISAIILGSTLIQLAALGQSEPTQKAMDQVVTTFGANFEFFIAPERKWSIPQSAYNYLMAGSVAVSRVATPETKARFQTIMAKFSPEPESPDQVKSS